MIQLRIALLLDLPQILIMLPENAGPAGHPASWNSSYVFHRRFQPSPFIIFLVLSPQVHMASVQNDFSRSQNKLKFWTVFRITSAPREITLHVSNSTLSTTYDVNGPAKQTFNFPDPFTELTQSVKLVVSSNWGHPEVACIYKIDIHWFFHSFSIAPNVFRNCLCFSIGRDTSARIRTFQNVFNNKPLRINLTESKSNLEWSRLSQPSHYLQLHLLLVNRNCHAQANLRKRSN